MPEKSMQRIVPCFFKAKSFVPYAKHLYEFPEARILLKKHNIHFTANCWVKT